MKRVVYRSISNLGPNDLGMLDIIRSCDRNNEAAGITGMLWFDGRFFLHAIEGPSAAVNDLFARLRKDTRHRSIHVIDVRRIGERRFRNFEVRFRHGIAAFDPLALGIVRTPVGPMLHSSAEAGSLPSYPAARGQEVTLPH